MSAPPHGERRPRNSATGSERSDTGPVGPPDRTDSTETRSERGRVASRRRLLACIGTTASVRLAGCSGRLPGNAVDVDVADRIEEGQLIWDYPASASEDGDSSGIGYAAVRFRVVDVAGSGGPVTPALTFRLNSTVGDIAADESHQGYRADWFRFRLGVPRSYDGVAGLRAFVQPKQWPEIRTVWGYQDSRRDLVVHAPTVNTHGTITVDGRFRPTDATLPRQVQCGFEVRASRPDPFGRTVVAAGRDMFDLSTLDLPDGITLA